jgi:Zn-dependent protease with chaperone function
VSAPLTQTGAPVSPGASLEAYDLARNTMRSSSIFGRVDTRRSRRRGRRAAAAAERPAQRAAARLFTVNVALGALAFASVLFVITRLAESWRVGPAQSAHSVSVFGQRWSYPVANAGAVTVAVLAGFGLIVLVVATRAATRELRADAGFRRALAELAPSSVHGARLVEDDQPRAFCAGLIHPRVYISRGALAMLGPAELEAVLAHERHHARRHDPLRLASTRVLADALFFAAPLRALIQRQHSLAEIGADEAAVAAAGGDRAPLASAMLSFSDADGTGTEGLAPERIDHLVGEGPAWRAPLAPLLFTYFCLAALVTLVALLAETARGSATFALPLLSAQPCVVMLALIPAGAAVAGLVCSRRRTRPNRRAVRRSAARS